MFHHPVCFPHLPLSHPTTNLMFCWFVEAVIVGSGGWKDCQSLPHAYSTSHLSTFMWVREPSLRTLLGGVWGFTLMQGRAGGRFIFLMQSQVKKGCDFLFGGWPFSLSHRLPVCGCVLSFWSRIESAFFPPPLLNCEGLLGFLLLFVGYCFPHFVGCDIPCKLAVRGCMFSFCPG